MHRLFIFLPVNVDVDSPPPIPKKTNSSDKNEKKEAEKFAWQPEEAGAMERALLKASGLSRRLVPFLLQNIGWFVSCFFFISGTVFLVTHSPDAMRSLIISLVLSTYTLMMLIGAWQLRTRRPDLHTAANVLTVLGMLLIPLCIAESVQLTLSMPMTGAALSLVLMFAFFWFSRLGSGMVDTGLHKSHNVLFMLLNAAQFSLIALNLFQTIYVLAGFHLMIMGISAFSILRFVRFGEEGRNTPRTTAYACGTLIYAAIISFAHLNYGYKPMLPPGYFSPFLMLLSGMLFYVDARVKSAFQEYPVLSRLSFGIYGLSVFALALSFQSDLFRIITFSLGIFVYGVAVSHYLTLTPLWLLLGCFSGLYYFIVLQHISIDAWFLAALPGFLLLLKIQSYLSRQGGRGLALISFRVRGILSGGLAFFSLWNGNLGLTSCITSLSIAAAIYAVLRSPKVRQYGGLYLDEKIAAFIASGADMRNTRLLYAVPFFVILAMAYAPLIPGAEWAEQLSFGLCFFAAYYTLSGLKLYGNITENNAVRISVSQNTGLICIFASLGLIFSYIELPMNNLLPLLIMGTGSLLLFAQSMILRHRVIFYGFLISGGATGVFIKQTFFPGMSTGLTECLISLCLWVLTSWLSRHIQLNKNSSEKFELLAETRPGLKVLGIFNIHPRPLAEMLKNPLYQAMALLWLIAMAKTGLHFFEYRLSLKWIFTAALETGLTVLIFVRFRLFRMMFLPMIVGLASLYSAVCFLGNISFSLFYVKEFVFITILYVFIVWMLASGIMKTRLFSRLNESANLCMTKIEMLRMEESLHRAACLFVIQSLIVIIWVWSIEPLSGLSLLPISGASLLFFAMSARIYRSPIYFYDFLVFTIFSFFFAFSDLVNIRYIEDVLVNSKAGLLLSSLSLIMGAGRHIRLSRRLYQIPLKRTAVFTAVIAAIQSGLLISLQRPELAHIMGLFLSSVGILLAADCRKNRFIRLCAIIMLSFSLANFTVFFSRPESLSYPMSLAILSGLVLAGVFVFKPFKNKGGALKNGWLLVSDWLGILPWLTLVSVLVWPANSLIEFIQIITMLAAIMAIAGIHQIRRIMFSVSKFLGLLLLHVWPLLFLPASGNGGKFIIPDIWPILVAQFERLKMLFPFWSSQLMLLVWGIIGLRSFQDGPLGERFAFFKAARLRISVLFAIAFGEWLFHVILFFQNQGDISGIIPKAQSGAMALSAFLFILLGIRRIRQRKSLLWIYNCSLIAGLAGVYLRGLLLGPIPPCEWDSVALIAAGGIYLMFWHMNRVPALSDTLLRFAAGLPLCSLFIAPWHPASTHAAAALLTAGAMYISIYNSTDRSAFLYGGTVLINASIYLWIPVWAANSNLLHLYTIPASMSVLMLLHLHRKELKRSVLNGARLAAVSVLYASATLDLFLRPEIWVFILVLCFSLTGIISGIAMRIRAFLFGGLAFMILNIASQIFLYSEGRMAKGIILVTLGAAVMGCMIWFNIKKEEILKKIRIFWADLEAWE